MVIWIEIAASSPVLSYESKNRGLLAMMYSNRAFTFAKDDEEKIKNQSVSLSSAFANASDFAGATTDKSADKCRQRLINPP